MLDHVGVIVSDLGASRRFYAAVLSTLGVEPTHADDALVEWEDWCLGPPDVDHAVTRGLHVAFRAPSPRAVEAFGRAALAAGARAVRVPAPGLAEGSAGERIVVSDPDGNRIEAIHEDRAAPVPDGRVSHLGISVRDPAASRRFQATVAPHTGVDLVLDTPGRVRLAGSGVSISLTIAEPDGGSPTEHLHVAFGGRDDAAVRAFHSAAVDAGYRSHGEPGERPRYHPGYYGAFVLDPDGTNVEVVVHHRG